MRGRSVDIDVAIGHQSGHCRPVHKQERSQSEMSEKEINGVVLSRSFGLCTWTWTWTCSSVSSGSDRQAVDFWTMTPHAQGCGRTR